MRSILHVPPVGALIRFLRPVRGSWAGWDPSEVYRVVHVDRQVHVRHVANGSGTMDPGKLYFTGWWIHADQGPLTKRQAERTT